MPDRLCDAEIARRQVSPHAQATPLVQFLYRQRGAALPVWWDGELRILPWGGQRGPLPAAGWCDANELEHPRWRASEPEAVEIPACMGHDGGVWYQILQGIRGIVVRDRNGPRVYMLTTAATHYYQVMTRSARMPVLIAQTI